MGTPGGKETPMTEHFAANIAATRTLLGLNRVELSVLLGCNKHTVKDWETARHAPTPDHLAHLTALREEHDALTRTYIQAAAAGETIRVPRHDSPGDRPAGWYLAAAARAKDAGDANVVWLPEPTR